MAADALTFGDLLDVRAPFAPARVQGSDLVLSAAEVRRMRQALRLIKHAIEAAHGRVATGPELSAEDRQDLLERLDAALGLSLTPLSPAPDVTGPLDFGPELQLLERLLEALEPEDQTVHA